MLSAADLQRAYIDLYTILRNYMWDLRTVEAIADLEVATYQQFPDIDVLRAKLHALKSQVYSTAQEDKDMKDAIDDFQKLLDDAEDIYSPIKSFREVIEVENN